MRKIMLSLIVFLSLAGLAGMQPAFAASDPLFHGDGNSDLCAGDAADSAVCKDKTDKNPLTGSDGLLVRITSIIAYVAGAAAVIVVIISGVRYITSGGDTAKVGSAKGALINAVIGLIVIVLARTLIVYVLNKL
jgi:hypothetical protein